MADTKISNMTALASSDVASGDLIPIVDVSEGTSGSKAITHQDLVQASLVFNIAGSTSGTDTYTISNTVALTALVTGMIYAVRFANANTSIAPTLNIDSLGAKTIKKPGGLALAAGEIAAGHPALLRYDGTDMILLNPAIAASWPKGYWYGGYIANNGSDANNDIDFRIGVRRDQGNTYNLTLSSAMTKQLDASWAAGTNQGGLFTGSKATSTTYHCFWIRKDSDGSIDAGFDTSLTAANIPAGYTAYRRVGSIRTDGSGNILPFLQEGSRFYWKTRKGDVSVTNLGGSQTLYALTIPIDHKFIAMLGSSFYKNGYAVNILIYDPDTTDESAGVSAFTVGSISTTAGQVMGSGYIEMPVNTSGQIAVRSDNTSVSLNMSTHGWVDIFDD